MGAPSGGLVDIDLDNSAARALADTVLGDMPAFGRESVGFGHRLCMCADAPQKISQLNIVNMEIARRLLSDEDKAMIVEIRADGQTMAPPSMHPHGERITWRHGDESREPPPVPYDNLKQDVGLLAFLSVVVMAYPGHAGCRNEICLALTGVLVQMGLEDERANRLVVAVATVAGDEEADTRGGRAAATRQKIQNDEPYWGLPKLLEDLNIKESEPEIRKWLRLGQPDESVPSDAIVIKPGQMAEIVDAAEAALIKRGEPIYRRGGELVYIEALDNYGHGNRQRTAYSFQPATMHWLLDQMARSTDWFKIGAKGNTFPADPKEQYANMLLKRSHKRFPELRGVLNAPTIDVATGRLIEKEGYDDATRLLLVDLKPYPPVPENPTLLDAEQALEKLKHLLRGFEFVSDADHSVAVAALLTGLVRPTCRTAPIIGITSPTAGTGKSLLAEAVCIVATGRKPPGLSQGKTPEEDEKRLASVLRAGRQVILIDNCERYVQGDFLCSMLTMEAVQTRILGKTQSLNLPTSALVIATGNNLTFAGDMTRRAVLIHLDAGVERPDERVFKWNVCDEAMDQREYLVVAGLTMLRAYDVAGRPEQLKPFGSFEDWDFIRGTLVWLGMSDPAETREAVLADDPKRDELGELLRLWELALGGGAFTLAELKKRLNSQGDGAQSQLWTCLTEMSRQGVWNAKSIGRNLSRHLNRPLEGRVLRADKYQGQNRWWVEVTTAEGSGDVDLQEDLPF